MSKAKREENPIKCTSCDRTYANKNSLGSHRRRKHRSQISNSGRVSKQARNKSKSLDLNLPDQCEPSPSPSLTSAPLTPLLQPEAVKFFNGEIFTNYEVALFSTEVIDNRGWSSLTPPWTPTLPTSATPSLCDDMLFGQFVNFEFFDQTLFKPEAGSEIEKIVEELKALEYAFIE